MLLRIPWVLTLIVGLLALGPIAAQAQESVPVTIIHDTHFHGGIESQDKVTLAQFSALVKKIKAEQPNAVFVGSGDDIAPSLYSGVFLGEHMIAALNAAGIDVDTLGNHEFDYGPENLRARLAQSQFPWVTGNARMKGSGQAFGEDLGVTKFLIREIGGVTFGFTGFAPVTTPTASQPGPDVEFLDPAVAAAELVPQMRAAGAQIVVVLSHIHYVDAERLAALVDGIDIIVGDHASTALEQPKVINNTIISRRGDELGLLGQLDLQVAGGKIASWTYTQHKLTPEHPSDELVATVLDEYKARLDVALGEVVGESAVQLDATRDGSRTRETNVGNLITDALRDWAQSDVAFQNGGGIRSDKLWDPAPLTRRDIVAILPFPNYGAKVRISGTALTAMLENSVSQVETGGGRFLQVSGLTFRYDPSAPAGSRIREVIVAGAPLDPVGSYTVAVNDFMLGGGDGYAMLRDAEVLIPGQAGPLVGNVLADYVKARGAVNPSVEGRITTGP